MTREEAIERFNGIINAMSISIAQSKFYPSKAELDELCGIAIEALLVKPQTDLISRANAIEVVYRKYPYNAEQNNCDEMVDALMALPSADVLKGDLISRQWLLEVYGDYIGDNDGPKYHVPIEVVRQNIKDAPSAEVIQGEWVDEDGNNVPLHKDGYPLRSCYCNQCHEWLVASDEYAVKGNFCPNCGAKMKGGAE